MTETKAPAPLTSEERIARAVAKGGPDALTNICPIVLGFGLAPDTDLANPLTLLRPVVRYTPMAHPLFDAVMDLAGARKMGQRTYSFGLGIKSSPEGLTMMLNCLPAGIVRHQGMVWNMPAASFTYDDRVGKMHVLAMRGYGSLPNHWLDDANLEAALDRHTEDHPNGALSRFCVTLNVTDRQLYVKLLTRGIVYDPAATPSTGAATVGDISSEAALDLGLFAPVDRREATRLIPSKAVAVAEWLTKAGYPITDLDTPGQLSELRDTVRRTVVATPVPGSPAMAELTAGADLDIPAAGALGRGSSVATSHVNAGIAIETVNALLRLADARPELGLAGAVDERLADVGRMALAAPVVNPLLRAYQQQAVGVQCATEVGMANFLAPGLGKSVVSLSGMRITAEECVSEGHAYRALVAVPAAIRMQWSHECAKWFPEARTLCVRTSHDAERLATAIAECGTSTPLVVITSYQMLAAVSDLADVAIEADFAGIRAYLDARDDAAGDGVEIPAKLVEILGRTTWNHLVCDEAALVLRNPGSKRYRALWEMRKNTKVALALTGTPIDKSLDDLGRLLAWVRSDADLFYGLRLSERFNVHDADGLAAYTEALGPLVFRRDRSEVADELPDIATEVVLLEGRPEEIALATAARTELRSIYEGLMEKMAEAEALHPTDPRYKDAREALTSARGAMLGGVTLARMAASDPATVASSESAGAMLLKSKGLVAAANKKPGTKRTQIVELVNDLVSRGEQVLIFTDFSTVADNLAADLRALDVPTGMVVGGQNDKVRDGFVSGYQDGKIKVLVCTSAAREGMNLQATTTLIHYDLPWSPSAVVQRVARANRIGAKGKSLQVLIPVMAGTIEERVSSLLVARAATAMAALDGGRGVEAKGTEMGLALGGLVESANEGELHGGETTMLDLAKAVLA